MMIPATNEKKIPTSKKMGFARLFIFPKLILIGFVSGDNQAREIQEK
jgi:hypothetical protein